MNLAPTLVVSLLVSSLATALFACGKADAGHSCAHDDECQSGACSLVGRCAPGECECSGAACGTTQSTCDDGQICFAGRPPFERGYNRCRATCSDERPCADAKVCANGVCEALSIDALRWGNLPRTVACTPGMECRYDLWVPVGVKIDSFRWDFGDAPGAQSVTREPTASHAFAKGGTFAVKVEAFAAGGKSFVLGRTENLCAVGLGEPCDLLGATCCVGSCQQSVCR